MEGAGENTMDTNTGRSQGCLGQSQYPGNSPSEDIGLQWAVGPGLYNTIQYYITLTI